MSCRNAILSLGLASVVLLTLAAVGCSDEKTTKPAETEIERITRIFPTSLHAARTGKATFYEAADGFRSLTNIPISQLACNKCHAANYADGTAVEHATYSPSCKDCHADPANPGANEVTDAICLGCHGRQGAEQNLFQDVHRTAGMNCTECHTPREMHGDGTAYPSFLAAGPSDVKCERCHTASASDNSYHATHLSKVHCSACHVKSVSSCYNCHFETEVQQEKKRFFAQAPRTGFKMLMNYEGKVHTATFQALSFGGRTFLAIAPFFGHSITKDDIACGDCHRMGGAGNANVQEYVDTDRIVVTKWDPAGEGAARLVGPTGVIPIPPDWQMSLQFDFLNYTGAATDPISGPNNLPLWDFLKTGADGSHIVYGSPLTADQMDKLANN